MNDLLKAVAPLLGTARAGPFGAMAASFLADKLGVQEKTIAAVQDVLTSATMSPEQVTAIKSAEIEFKKWMADNGIKLKQLEAADRADARDMFKVTRSMVPAILTFMITFGFFGVLIAMFLYPEVKESSPLMIMLGSLGTAWTGACAFWFGTTSSSASKTEMLANAQPLR